VEEMASGCGDRSESVLEHTLKHVTGVKIPQHKVKWFIKKMLYKIHSVEFLSVVKREELKDRLGDFRLLKQNSVRASV
jgi:hypothetical protein